MDDLQKLLEIAKGTDKVKWSENETLANDIPKFINFYNIKSGSDKVHCLLLEILYQSWSKNPIKQRGFHKITKKFIDHNKNKKELIYMLDLEALSINIDEINKIIGPSLLKRANEEIEKKKKRSVEALGSSPD